MLFLLLLACSSPSTVARSCAIPAAEAKVAPSFAQQAPELNPTFLMYVTGYSSTVDQTDKTPCIAADMSNICERHARGESICAARKFPFGTRLKIDDLGTCTVADRTNKKYSNRVDWYFGHDLASAKAFEKKRLLVEVLP